MGARKILVLGTGGTIAGGAASADDNVGYRAGERSVQALLQGLGEPPLSAGMLLAAEQVAQIDSKDAGFAFWAALHARCAVHLADEAVQGIVVTHGTDTLEETAWLLACTLEVRKPLVLTCAMRPATALSPDGPQNLRDALALACEPRAPGVSVVCGGAVHLPRHVQKLHPYRVDAFGSGEAGPAGWMEEGRLRLAHPWPVAGSDSDARDAGHWRSMLAASLPQDAAAWPWVEIVLSYAGARAAQVDVLVQAGVRGIVVAGTGNGTLHEDLLAALHRAQHAGVAVRVGTRCVYGEVVGTPSHGLPLTGGLSPVKARIALMLALMHAA